MIDYDAVKRQVSIRDTLSNYGVQCRGRTDKFRVPCPIHNGRDSNMAIDEDKGLFYCFVCGAKGSVIDLVSNLEGITVQEAAQRLGDGVVVSDRHTVEWHKSLRQIDRWKEFTNATTGPVGIPFQVRDLPAGYRDFSARAILHYGLGLCDQGVYIPHVGLSGSVVGYSIRRPDGSVPKYLNNTGFPKHIPFGLYQNKDQIIKRGFAIVCEGQFDSITLWDRGYMNVVSVMGSSLSEQQAHLLLGLTTKLMLLFDGDKAGIKGALRTHRRWRQVFDIDVKILPPGTDPAEYMANV